MDIQTQIPETELSPERPAIAGTTEAEAPSPEGAEEMEASALKGDARKLAGGIQLLTPEPWPEPVEGVGLLDALRDVFQRHLATPEGAAEARALWVMFSHTHDAHRSSPRLAFVSPVPECGKTTALSILENLVPRALATSNITPAVIFRIIEKQQPTLLIDEADTFLHGSEDMRGILNSGHTRATAKVWRCVGDDRDPRGFSTRAPLAIAKIGNTNLS